MSRSPCFQAVVPSMKRRAVDPEITEFVRLSTARKLSTSGTKGARCEYRRMRNSWEIAGYIVFAVPRYRDKVRREQCEKISECMSVDEVTGF